MQEKGNAPDNKLIEAQKIAVQLIERNKRIVQIAGVLDTGSANNPRLNLVCRFEPEPDCNSTGFFWIAFLMTRLEFENDSQGGELNWSFDIGFNIGEDIFLPNGKVLKAPSDYITIWPPDHE